MLEAKMNKVTTVDLRTKRTKKLIFDTFQQMMAEKPFEEITVKELSERAGINRKTFYSHYDTIVDLRNALVEEMLCHIRDRIKNDKPHSFRDTLTALYGYLCGLPVWSRNLLAATGSDFAAMINRQIFEERAETLKNPANLRELSFYLKYHYISAAFASLFQAWNQYSDMMSKEEFIRITTGFILQGESFVQ